MIEVYYSLTDTRLGHIGFVWTYEKEKLLVKRICISGEDEQVESMIRDDFPQAVKGSDDIVDRMGDAVRQYLDGGKDHLSLDYLDLDVCGDFQKNVLQLNRQIPKGMVATYSGLARKLNIPKAARAVGNAQACNPFPIIIPCHRVVRSDGALGGFGGGLEMKKSLLQLEGVSFDAKGKVCPEHLWL